MWTRFVLSAVMLGLLGISPISVLAKKPPPNDDGGKEWYLFRIHDPSFFEVQAFIDKYDEVYAESSATATVLNNNCWDPKMLRTFKSPGEANTAVLCEKTGDSIAAMVDVLLRLNSPSMQIASTGSCTGQMCTQSDHTTNCTKYPCPGFASTTCFHYQMPCSAHKCK